MPKGMRVQVPPRALSNSICVLLKSGSRTAFCARRFKKKKKIDPFWLDEPRFRVDATSAQTFPIPRRHNQHQEGLWPHGLRIMQSHDS